MKFVFLEVRFILNTLYSIKKMKSICASSISGNLCRVSFRRLSEAALVKSSETPKATPSYKTRRTGLLQISRFEPETCAQKIDSYTYAINNQYMVLDLLIAVKAHQDPTLAFRASCSEGVCGSCAMNINGINSLACITHACDATTVAPLPNMPIIKDLVVDFKMFFTQYSFIRPYVRNTNLDRHHIQSIFGRYDQAMKLRNNVYLPNSEEQRTCKFSSAPQKLSIYMKLLEKLIEKKDLAKGMYVLRHIIQNKNIDIPIHLIREYIAAFYA